MCDTPEHIKWLVKTSENLNTTDGKPVEVWEFCHQPDAKVLSAWAKHFRNHYCSDNDIDNECYPHSRAEYLSNEIFPDVRQFPGPMTRAGDFGEILAADFFEYVMGFWVPRVRYNDKLKRNQSTQGSDMIGFKFVSDEESPDDILLVTEAKAQFTGRTMDPKLQEAVDHSIKDQIRKATSLNWIKRRVLKNLPAEEKEYYKLRLERFQTPVDRPYTEWSGATALVTTEIYDPAIIQATTTDKHPNSTNIILIVIRGTAMMGLVHELYRRAADEA